MNKDVKRELVEVYQRYGFEPAKTYENDKVLVFTIKTGYFDNADIVPLVEGINVQQAFDDYSKAGFACTVRHVQTPNQTERQLFKGFFSVESILTRLDYDYERFTKGIVAPFSADAQYEYINAPYRVNGQPGNLSPAEEVATRLDSHKPILFLIEAAAGFGKTCTAYELVHLLTQRGEYLPLFSELARNRQAVIFRYILLDEIDRTFPVLSSRLVQTEMKNGRVITILDGFDELLRKTEEGNDFENKEPMLETIGEFLTGNAKIVLTTRRTVLFEGDAFHTWVERHSDDFDLVRIRISEPRVDNWLDKSRLSKLKETGLRIKDIANPVLLSYLRCISDVDFEKASSEPHLLVEKYFDFMLDREKSRQDLRLNPDKQQEVLCSIAEDMIAFGYTSEHRDYIVDHIQRVNSNIIDEALSAYPAAEKPTKEGVANKLASHALLDRSQREPNKIGFINEFVLGHFVAKIILRTSDWLNDDLRFIEPAVISFQPRSEESRILLWEKLKNSVEFLPISYQLDITLRLTGSIPFDLCNDEANGLEISQAVIGSKLISNFQFNECIFRNCVFDLSNITNATFLNCKYYGNSFLNSNAKGQIHILGAFGDDNFIDTLISSNTPISEEIEPDRSILLERFILEKFWPVGREAVMHRHRPIKGVCVNNGEFKTNELCSAIASLKKKGILKEPMQSAFIEINLDEIQAIREILGRNLVNGK
ncbi:MAG TPA: hypothetical protein VIG33_12590 [Pseudobdellovibrionaceae bacterium]